MSRDDLMALLDLKPTSKKADPLAAVATQNERRSTSSSATALKLDKWDLAQGERCNASLPKIKGLELSNEAVADFHGAAFMQRPQLNDEPCTDELRQQFMQTLLDSPEYRVLHESTVANALTSEMATVTFAEQFHKLVIDQQEQQQNQQPGQGSGNGEADQLAQEMACLAAVGAAVSQAQQQVQQVEDMQGALGIGNDPNAHEQQLDTKTMAAMLKRVQSSELLRRICELSGRYIRCMQAIQRKKVQHGYDDMVGVELSGDVGRLLPSELAMLSDPDFELDALRRLAERQSLCREYRGIDRVAKGPVVICVDESGSMEGEPVCNAKAFALAMARLAIMQRRHCVLVSYYAGTPTKIVVLPPGRQNKEELVDWLVHFFDGGSTDMTVPFSVIPQQWDALGVTRGKTDMIVITDGIVQVPDALAQSFGAWKSAEQCKLVTIVIGQGSAGDLEKISDECHTVNAIDVQSDAVQSCFSI